MRTQQMIVMIREKFNVYSIGEISKHNSRDQLMAIVIIKGNVYDLTGFVNKHPGGGSIILNSMRIGSAETVCEEGVGVSWHLENQDGTEKIGKYENWKTWRIVYSQ